ncbi:MAG: polysulfide reductase NrfD, partial [Cyclobacteriaceae bacterium]|nr:polysulfide reductase NrfD [Cyclobacteriaceae bacterium]
MEEHSNNFGKEELIKKLRPSAFGTPGKIWTAALLVIFFVGVLGYISQLRNGLVVTGMRDYASWGIYISNFVFFVAISLVGSLISAILYLAGAKWGAPLNRIAEIIAVSAISFAGLIIIVDMGRPERLWHLFVYGRLQSPIIWDVVVITTYLFISVLLLYLPLIPDMKLLSDHSDDPDSWLTRFYRIMSLNWKGLPGQRAIVHKGVKILAITIIPVALAIHTVTSWLFATTYRPGWDSTNFGAYFVSGAFLVGAACVTIGMYVYRRAYHLEHYITDDHFNRMGKLTVMLGLLYLYFNVNEYLVPGFKMKTAEAEHLNGLLVGHYATLFWSVIILGMLVPVLLMMTSKGRKPMPMFVIAVMITVGAWFKRFLIVTPTLLHPFLPMQDVPASYMEYVPTLIESAVTLGSLAGVLLIITFFTRYFPIIPIDELIQSHKQGNETTRRPVSSPVKTTVATLLVFLMAWPLAAQDKASARIGMDYFSDMDKGPSLQVTVRTRVDRRYQPVEGVSVTITHDESGQPLGEVTTGADGKGLLWIPESFKPMFDTLHLLSFTATIQDNDTYDDAENSISVSKASMEMELAVEDSVKTIRVKLSGYMDGEMQPLADRPVNFYVQRLFSLLPVGGEYNSTDEDGWVEIVFPDDIPGNTSGEVQLVA